MTNSPHLTFAEHVILAKNNMLHLSISKDANSYRHETAVDNKYLPTIISNLAYFGYKPSKRLFKALALMSLSELVEFNKQMKKVLAEVTGTSKRMGSFVVYKNFPSEVLEMGPSDYWLRQIFIYLGVPAELVGQPEQERDLINLTESHKILDIAPPNALDALMRKLISGGASWNDTQSDTAQTLIQRGVISSINFREYGHRQNAASLAAYSLKSGLSPDIISTTSATDVLRIAKAMSSEGFKVPAWSVKFKKFSRPLRRALVNLIEGSSDPARDFARDREQWKRLLSILHPGDFKALRTTAAYDELYHGSPNRRTALIARAYADKDEAVFPILAAEPGTFMRELNHAYSIFGRTAIDHFIKATRHLTVEQLLKIQGYLRSCRHSVKFIVPKGDWEKALPLDGKPSSISIEDARDLYDFVTNEVSRRINLFLPQGFDAQDPRLKQVKLQTNGQDLASYGRGTVLPIPENMSFVRTASYWKVKSHGNIWYDNSWNFFSEDWSPMSACCWNNPQPNGSYAVFSGDPTSTSDLMGRACQMIDLNIENMKKAGLRYAAWSVLGFSGLKFSEAEEVLATLQWGEDPHQGDLYEPSRAQMVFPLRSEALNSCVAYIDLHKMHLVYLDAGFSLSTSSAEYNSDRLSKLLAASACYTDRVPSLYDLFGGSRGGEIKVRYDDKNEPVAGLSYVAHQSNSESLYEQLNLHDLLGLKG